MSLWSLQEAKKYTDKEVKTVDDRITTLTIEQQQDGEVIEARKGEVSLKAKMDSIDAQLAETMKDGFNANEFLEMSEKYLELPSSLGSSLTTHPSVIDFGEGQLWNGYRYWMAHTPYPGTQNENPSIAVSNDNKTWVLPTGAPNPLVSAPTAPAYNSDVEMVYLDDVNKLRMYYREFSLDEMIRIYYIESSDGSNWSSPALSIETSNLALSPAIIRENATSWKMWTVENDRKMHFRTSSDGISWNEPTIINQPFSKWVMWHIGITKDSNRKYHMLASTYPDSGSGEGTQYRPIIYASSEDGLDWTPIEKPQLIPTGWAGGYLYRPTFIIDESKGLKDGIPYVKVWFGASDDAVANAWHIGYSEGFLMSGNENPSATSEKTKRKKMGEYFKVFASNIVAPFAKVSRLLVKRIQVTSDYSQPIVEFRDGRKNRDGGNYLREEYQGSADENLIRHRFIYVDDNGNDYTLTIVPFGETPALTFKTPTNMDNIKQLIADEIISNTNIRLQNGSKQNRLLTSSAGNLIVQLLGGGGNYNWTFRGDGQLDAGNNGAYNQSFLGLTAQASRPAHLGSSNLGIYLADGVDHDPLNLAGGVPYLVYWDGANYTKLN